MLFSHVRPNCFMFRLVNKEILDQLKVVKSQETLLVFNENIDMAVAHISVSCCVTVSKWRISDSIAVAEEWSPPFLIHLREHVDEFLSESRDQLIK